MLIQRIWNKIKEKKCLIIGISCFIFVAILIGASIKFKQKNDVNLGTAGDDRGQWVVIDKFDGYQTKKDPQKIDKGANPVGQNTFINDGDRISVRDFGYEIFPDSSARDSSPTSSISLHTFRKRDGTNILLHTYDDELAYYAEKIGRWERLKDGYAVGSEFGFADHNTNSDQTSYVYFGNGVQDYSRWTGNIAKLTSAVTSTATSLLVDDTTLFPASGTVEVCGNALSYTSKTATSFQIAAATSTCASGRGVAQVPETFPAGPKGNILITLNTRIFIAGVASSTQALFYSKIADGSDFSIASSTTHLASDAGIINMPEGGGGIVGMAVDEQVLYVFKRNIIKSVTFTQDADDLPIVKPVKPYDNKSQTVGAVSKKSIFSGGNGIFFITPNNEIMNLSRVEQVDYPQVTPISDIISNTTDGMSFASSTGVYWHNQAYFSAKANSDSSNNDTILIWDSQNKLWHSPVIGIAANEFSIAKFGNDEDLYFAEATQPNVHKINSTGIDDLYGITSNWRSKEETFGAPELLKSIDNFYVEGYIDDNTEITVSLLFDEDGFSQIYTGTFTGNESNDKYRYTSSDFNLFGFNPFGYERFGNNDDASGKKKFRIYFGNGVRRIGFHSVQVEFASESENQNWEILSYAFRVMFEPQETDKNLYKSF